MCGTKRRLISASFIGAASNTVVIVDRNLEMMKNGGGGEFKDLQGDRQRKTTKEPQTAYPETRLAFEE
jgi:hypothetical protein